MPSTKFNISVWDKQEQKASTDVTRDRRVEIKSLATVLANLPQQSEILAMPLTKHPRPILSTDRLEEMKQQIETDEVMQQWYKEIRWKANYYPSVSV